MSRLPAPKLALAVPVMLVAAGMLHAQSATPLTATPASVSVSYQKPSTAGPTVTVKISAAASTYFTVDASSVPFWLSVGSMTGTANSTGVNVTFDPSSVASTLADGTYTGSVHVKVTGYQDLLVPVTLAVSAAAPTLSITEGTTITINWNQGSAYPTQTLT